MSCRSLPVKRKKRKGIAISTLATQTIKQKDEAKKKANPKAHIWSMKPYDRFFASLFQSSIFDLAGSNSNEELRAKVLDATCSSLDLPMPKKIPNTYNNGTEMYKMRASLVIEEARWTLSEVLARQGSSWKTSNGKIKDAIEASLVSVKKKGKTSTLTFDKGITFEAKELFNLKPGCCFLLKPRGKNKHNSAAFYDQGLLASVVPDRSFDKDGSTVAMMVYEYYHGETNLNDSCSWQLIPLVSLISSIRQFEACASCDNLDVAFMPKLLVSKTATPVKFPPDSEEELSSSRKFLLPTLNTTQARAARTFLSSPSSSLALVQGPPGTGKTTFLISTIARCLEECNRRVLVCAPTNKAISVLSSRFLRALDGDASFNVVLIGVEEKLAGDDALFCKNASLRRVFVYTWMQAIINDFILLRDQISSRRVVKEILPRAVQLCKKLFNSIPNILRNVGFKSAKKFLKIIEDLEKVTPTGKDQNSTKAAKYRKDSEKWLGSLISTLKTVDGSLATSELLDTADLIFCTLSSSAVSPMKQTRRVDDLFVDEAAAAPESELYIPFHLMPKRMLAVGDPQQLPATVMSKYAIRYGLAKSLMERLIFDCKLDHIMLDCQYRMHPHISSWPVNHFYNGKVRNGTNVETRKYPFGLTINTTPYRFLHVVGYEQNGKGGSYSNEEEAMAVVDIVKSLQKKASKYREENKSIPWHSAERIRIITFYQGQVTLIRRMLNSNGLGKVLVATVDSSQGCEADIVIVSFVRSNLRQRTGFLQEDRRLNVALTRAKYQLICVGNAYGTLSQSTTLKALITNAEHRNCISSQSDMSSDSSSLLEAATPNSGKREAASESLSKENEVPAAKKPKNFVNEKSEDSNTSVEV